MTSAAALGAHRLHRPARPGKVSKLDDYMIFAPTADPKRLVLYSNMSFNGPGGLPFIGSAVLVNP